MSEHTVSRGCDGARPNGPFLAPQTPSTRWQDSASCVGRTDLMYDHARRAEAKALCAACPVGPLCLWAAMAAEVDEPYRYGIAGGLGPLQRRRLADRVPRSDMAEQLGQALAAWGAQEAPAPARTPWRPPAPAYRPRRRCRGCKAVIRQPKAGRPQRWCSSACRGRTVRDRSVDASRNRRRWAELPEEAREARRAGMRARWAALSAQERAELASRRRQRRQQARAAS